MNAVQHTQTIMVDHAAPPIGELDVDIDSVNGAGVLVLAAGVDTPGPKVRDVRCPRCGRRTTAARGCRMLCDGVDVHEYRPSSTKH